MEQLKVLVVDDEARMRKLVKPVTERKPWIFFSSRKILP